MAQREIKFRGKHLTGGDWRYGYLSKYWNSNMDIVFVIIKESDNRLSIATSQIDENTISQFTGLHDKNGKEIYESDKISNGKAIFTILWNPDLCCFDMERHEGDNKYLNEMAHIIQEKYEVIGNIYE